MTQPDRTLSSHELATATDVSLEKVRALVEAGVLEPVGPDAFRPGDIQRVLVATALEASGLTLQHLRQGVELGLVSFEQTDVIYPDPGPLSPRSVADLASELNLSNEALLRIITAFGLPRPDASDHLRLADETQLRDFVHAWQPLGDDELLVRAARAYGDALRRAAEGWMSLFEEAVLLPIVDRAIPWHEMSRRALEPGLPVLRVGSSILPWLLDRHRVPALNRLNFDSIERMLSLSGVAAAPRDPVAIVFADLAGYTRLTEERGDEAAARLATRLADLANEIAGDHGGRLVKLLGDGVMMHFPSPPDAVTAALALRDAMAPSSLPPAHTGIAAGGVIRRESDFFGRTVNLAARLAGAARAREILVTGPVAQVIRETDGRLADLHGPERRELKGIPEPVEVWRVS